MKRFHSRPLSLCAPLLFSAPACGARLYFLSLLLFFFSFAALLLLLVDSRIQYSSSDFLLLSLFLSGESWNAVR